MQPVDVYIGFDSAWTDDVKAPGAICAVAIQAKKCIAWYPPRLVRFGEATHFIKSIQSTSGVTLLALDQPTIVPNPTSNRPVEKVVSSLVSWVGGGVQPSNRGRTGMFCDASPIWRFLAALEAVENPNLARKAETGFYLIEVFPAASLPSIAPDSCARLKGLQYNPGRKKTFSLKDWKSASSACAAEAAAYNLAEAVEWCHSCAGLERPRKADQDRLDSIICLLVALRWRLADQRKSTWIGDLASGYMVLPTSAEVQTRLMTAALRHKVAIDGVLYQ